MLVWQKNIIITMDEENKKCVHRETEKQRRQEMGKLFTTLRSLLPLEYIKGKRSTSDHVYEAMNYITHMENNVKQLEAKRDELMKEVSNLHTTISPRNESSSSTQVPPPLVIVHPFPGGVEIVCSYSLKCVFPLSRVLDILLREGLDVVSSTSTKVDERFIHTIRSEDPIHRNITDTDYSDQLQRKLSELISSIRVEETLLPEPQNC